MTMLKWFDKDENNKKIKLSPKVSPQHKSEIQEKIIDAAILSFSKRGFDKTRMEDIAVESNIGKGTLYLYFRSKEDLFHTICEKNIKKIKEQLDMLFFQKKKQDLLYNTEKFYDNFQNMVNDDDKTVFFEVIAESSRNPRLRKVMYEQRLKIFELVSKYLSLQIEKGFLKKDIGVESISSGLVALYDGLTLSKVLKMNNDFNKKVWTETIKSIFTTLIKE